MKQIITIFILISSLSAHAALPPRWHDASEQEINHAQRQYCDQKDCVDKSITAAIVCCLGYMVINGINNTQQLKTQNIELKPKMA